MRMSRLVDGMFDISMLDLRAESGYCDSCELGASLAATVDVLAPFAAERRTAMVCEASADCVVAIGSDRLMQILVNVIENAIKHGRAGGALSRSLRAGWTTAMSRCGWTTTVPAYPQPNANRFLCSRGAERAPERAGRVSGSPSCA